MSISNGVKIGTLVSAANGDTYGDAERHQFRTWQALVMPNVKQVGLTTPPGGPSNGDTYVVGVGASGAWNGKDNNIAYWAVDAQDGSSITSLPAWEFYTQLPGWRVYDNTTNLVWKYNGTAWLPAAYSNTVTGSGTTAIVAYPVTVVFPAQPIVVVTPTTNAGAFYLSAQSASGFTITYANSGAQAFNYIVSGS